jgi:hypothetical protein
MNVGDYSCGSFGPFIWSRLRGRYFAIDAFGWSLHMRPGNWRVFRIPDDE